MAVGTEPRLPDVTLVLCTCRRLPLFLETLYSLRSNLPELADVSRIVVIDDNSSAADRLVMRRELSQAEFVFKSHADAGHARSLNMMLALVRTPWLVYWEDDCVLQTRGEWLSKARAALSGKSTLISVSFDPSIENDVRCAQHRTWRPEAAALELRTHIPETLERYRPPSEFLYQRDPWPGFSLKPNMLAVQRARQVGPFAEHEPDHMEYEFGLRCLQCGMRTAILPGPVIRDIGAASSAYILNGRPRSYDRIEGSRQHSAAERTISSSPGFGEDDGSRSIG